MAGKRERGVEGEGERGGGRESKRAIRRRRRRRRRRRMKEGKMEGVDLKWVMNYEH